MLVNRRKNISTNTRNVIGLKSPLKKNESQILKKGGHFPLSILTGRMEYDISEPESPYLRKNKKNRKFIDLKSLFNFFPRFFSEIKSLLHSKKYKTALKMCEFYFNQERKFNCFNEIKMNRINCRILQKIIEKRIENNYENKDNIEENLLKHYIKSFNFWFKFLTSDINNLKNWNIDVLKQEFNDYPTLFTENEELISFDLNHLKLPDFVQFSLKNQKSELEIEKQISYEMGEFVLNFLNLYFLYALKYKKDKNYRMSYLFAKNAYKISKLCLRSINPDIIHMCVEIRIFLGNFNLEFGRLQKSEYLFETSLVLLEHELSIRESLNNLSNNYKNHGYHFKKIIRTILVLLVSYSILKFKDKKKNYLKIYESINFANWINENFHFSLSDDNIPKLIRTLYNAIILKKLKPYFETIGELDQIIINESRKFPNLINKFSKQITKKQSICDTIELKMFKKYDFKQNLSSKLIPFKIVKISDPPSEKKIVKENLDNSKKEDSFDTDEETLLELSSIVCESSFETMNNIVDLEEKKKKTLKKTFQKKFIAKFNSDYRPKILTTTKYFTNNKQKSNSLHLLSTKKPLFLDNFFAEKVEKTLNANYSNNKIDLINENFTNEFKNENFDKKEFAFAHKLLLMKKKERTRKPNPFSITKNIPPKEVFTSKFSQNLSFSISKENLQNSAAEYEKVNLLQKILRKIKLNINLSKDETKFIRQQNFSNKILTKLQLENGNKVYLAKKRALNTIKFTKFIEKTSEILDPEYKNSKRRAASLEFNQSPLKKNIKNNNSNVKEISKVKFQENLRKMVFNTNNMILEDKKSELFNQMKTKKNRNIFEKNARFLDFSDLATSIIKNEKKECQNL